MIRPIRMASSWPRVVINPTLAPPRVISLFVRLVVPMATAREFAQHVVDIEALALGDIGKGIDHALTRIARDSEALVGQDASGLVDDDAVRKRAADIDPDNVPVGHPALRALQALMISAVAMVFGPMIFKAHSCSSGT